MDEPKAPSLKLSGRTVNAPDGVRVPEESKASYAIQWIMQPNKGTYVLSGDSAGAVVAVLRPANLLLDVRPQPPAAQTSFTMAEVQFPLRVIVRPATGSRADPGEDLEFSFQTHGPRVNERYEWDGRSHGAAKPEGEFKTGSDGRTYDIFPIFPKDRPDSGREFYEAWLTPPAASSTSEANARPPSLVLTFGITVTYSVRLREPTV